MTQIGVALKGDLSLNLDSCSKDFRLDSDLSFGTHEQSLCFLFWRINILRSLMCSLPFSFFLLLVLSAGLGGKMHCIYVHGGGIQFPLKGSIHCVFSSYCIPMAC